MAATPANMPAAEFDITVELVAKLVRQQFPALGDLPIAALDHGWDNALFRLGDDLVVRLPRRDVAAALILHERRWLPDLCTDLPLPTSAPLHAGVASAAFPWPWNIAAYLPGTSVMTIIDRGMPFDMVDAATRLGAFLAAFHCAAPPDAPANPYRGIPLADRDDVFHQHLSSLPTADHDPLLALWWDALDVPVWTGPNVWVHGDIHPGNLIGQDGRLTGVIDFGDLTAGDPASDLSIAWMAFDDDARAAFRAAVDVDDDTWARGHGWAVALSVAIAANSADNPPYARFAARALTRLLHPAR